MGIGQNEMKKWLLLAAQLSSLLLGLTALTSLLLALAAHDHCACAT